MSPSLLGRHINVFSASGTGTAILTFFALHGLLHSLPSGRTGNPMPVIYQAYISHLSEQDPGIRLDTPHTLEPRPLSIPCLHASADVLGSDKEIDDSASMRVDAVKAQRRGLRRQRSFICRDGALHTWSGARGHYTVLIVVWTVRPPTECPSGKTGRCRYSRERRGRRASASEGTGSLRNRICGRQRCGVCALPYHLRNYRVSAPWLRRCSGAVKPGFATPLSSLTSRLTSAISSAECRPPSPSGVWTNR
jgi:hypothetical protein